MGVLVLRVFLRAFDLPWRATYKIHPCSRLAQQSFLSLLSFSCLLLFTFVPCSLWFGHEEHPLPGDVVVGRGVTVGATGDGGGDRRGGRGAAQRRCRPGGGADRAVAVVAAGDGAADEGRAIGHGRLRPSCLAAWRAQMDRPRRCKHLCVCVCVFLLLRVTFSASICSPLQLQVNYYVFIRKKKGQLRVNLP